MQPRTAKGDATFMSTLYGTETGYGPVMADIVLAHEAKDFKIVMDADLPDRIMRHGKDAAAAMAKTGVPDVQLNNRDATCKASANEYLAEATRMSEIAKLIASGQVDLFKYLPYTKSGRLNQARHVVLAESKCKLVANAGEWVGVGTLQLRLVPTVKDIDDILAGNKYHDVMAVVFDVWPKTNLTPPVFDANGRPSVPVTAKSGNLRDKDVMPGSVYLSGKTEFLYLGRLMLVHNKFYDGHDFVQHVYVKHTKAVAEVMETVNPQNVVDAYLALFDALDPIDKFGSLTSYRETPKKFQSLVKTYIPADDESRLVGPLPEDRDYWWTDYSNPPTSDNYRKGSFVVRPPEGKKFVYARVWLESTDVA